MSAAVISPNLFEAARLGDAEAIARLLETTQPDIRRYARATCRSSADAEDATQEYRDVALMRDVKEMTIDEIAATLGASRQTVKARLHRARALMREYLTR
ncbi:RNA polymerase sigma factor [Bradyrhizobium yuanmingense]|uniref:RNA polymerase sigma factor n=1 Tax=Bradyrhizobium yuanmingense TaxID=108015 RepID=UPI0023B8F79D|nr:sigma factor-like helix-turn-helix DNA-binding protein [Bradyrhizobium yuanmingense]MDF0495304.1 sigma factor-like helix-turn-helix DNA-binding protein [Bradyrhizobium yuanmingense]